jgi:hypothetical protein
MSRATEGVAISGVPGVGSAAEPSAAEPSAAETSAAEPSVASKPKAGSAALGEACGSAQTQSERPVAQPAIVRFFIFTDMIRTGSAQSEGPPETVSRGAGCLRGVFGDGPERSGNGRALGWVTERADLPDCGARARPSVRHWDVGLRAKSARQGGILWVTFE